LTAKRVCNLPALLTLALSASSATAAPTAQAPTPGLSEDCFEELEKGKGSEIACGFPLRLTEEERADLEKATRGYLKNLACLMTIRIARDKVDEAIEASDLTFQSPDQPVSCTVTTPKSTFEVTATFAPRVVFKGDVAVSASPGLGNVKGVSRVLSWPVVAYVNYGPGMHSNMLKVVNAYRAHVRRKRRPTSAP
jgi:hypothetical protein